MAVLTKSAPPPVPPNASPIERADASRRAARAHLADVRRAFEHAEAHPLDYPEASYATTMDELRHALARAAAAANRAEAAFEQAVRDDQAAKLAAAVDAEARLSKELEDAEAALTAWVAEVGASDAVARVAEARRARDANRQAIREGGGRVTARDERTSLAFAWPSLVSATKGGEGVLLTAAAVAKWLAGAPAREREAAEYERRRSEERERGRLEAALRGDFGPEARKAAEAERSKAIAAFYGPRSATAKIAPEVAGYRKAAGLSEE